MALRISRRQLRTLRTVSDASEARQLLKNLVRQARQAQRARPADRFVGTAAPNSAPVAFTQNAIATGLTAPQSDLQKGAQGPEVEALQRALVALGYLTQEQMNTGPGIFGPKTFAAVQAFQSDWGVPSTGNYGPLTREALTKALSGQAKPPPPPAGTYDGTHPATGTTNTSAWIPVNAPVKGNPNERSRATYDNVINQFAVGVNPRYAPRDGNTYCNIFAWDVTRAMGAEIPHWVDNAGHPVGVGQGHELDANATNSWLNAHGAEYGWRKVSAQEAQALANQGHPAVASWRNPGGIGHIGVVRPGEATNGPALAQAGAQNFNHGHVYDVFPDNGTEFWVNDKGAVTSNPTGPGPTPPPAEPPATTPPPPSASGVPQIDLQRGMEGEEVRELQTSLVQLGFLSQADMNTGPGIFGPRTEAAVKAFQSAHGVPNTGYYGPLTRAALAKALGGATPAPEPQPAPAPAPSVPQVDLQRGAEGVEVRALQSALVQLGFMSQADMDTGPGIFGPRTEAAVKAFQSAWSVPSTGYFGPLTREALTKALSGAQPATPPSQSISGAEQAIAYAFNPPPNPMDPNGSWHYWCLGLVNKAYQSAGRTIPELQKPKAYDSYLAYANEGKVHTGTPAPRGALVFFNSYMPYGHIGISLGDGTYVGTFESGPASGVRSLNTGTYLGWAYP